MNKLYYLFLQIFVVVQVIKGEATATTEDLTTVEMVTFNSRTTAIEDILTTEGATAIGGATGTGGATATEGVTATGGVTVTEGATAAGGATATEGVTITAGATTTAGSSQPTTTKTTLSGVTTQPENVNKGAQLLFNCNASACSFEFIVPELLLRHVDPGQLKEAIGLLSNQISSVKTELDLAKLNESTYSQDINDWINRINETEVDLKANITTLTNFNDDVQHQVDDVSNKAEAYLKSALCFANRESDSLSCKPSNFLPTTATFTTESTEITTDSV